MEKLDLRRIKKILYNRKKIKDDHLLYYNEKKDRRIKTSYYQHINFNEDNRRKNFQQLHQLIKTTHHYHVPYFISKDEYLYTWVDLQPNGTVKNIYSGAEDNPTDLLENDLNVLNKFRDENSLSEFSAVELKFNAEHIVPQSWFGAHEPMKGDLHHLFACEPHCNTARANFAYYDFSFYVPESSEETIRNHCGVATAQLFEPEFGKGIVARAMFYFLLRYPKKIKATYSRKINFELLREWHKEFPPDLYEKHRNFAIHEIQGNRNPFIDFPEFANRCYFPI